MAGQGARESLQITEGTPPAGDGVFEVHAMKETGTVTPGQLLGPTTEDRRVEDFTPVGGILEALISQNQKPPSGLTDRAKTRAG